MRKTVDATDAADSDGGAPGHDNATGSDDNEHGGEASTAATEIGGRDGPDPTRYGDWEKNGRCIDF